MDKESTSKCWTMSHKILQVKNKNKKLQTSLKEKKQQRCDKTIRCYNFLSKKKYLKRYRIDKIKLIDWFYNIVQSFHVRTG